MGLCHGLVMDFMEETWPAVVLGGTLSKRTVWKYDGFPQREKPPGGQVLSGDNHNKLPDG